VVRYLAAEAGIRQFLDIGTGLPTSPNVHEVAQGIIPEARIVYVDSDPIVLLHAQALLTSSPEGAVAYLDADLRDPEKILGEAAKTLDFGQPMAVLLLASCIASAIRTIRTASSAGWCRPCPAAATWRYVTSRRKSTQSWPSGHGH
jgi:hypothetical protein